MRDTPSYALFFHWHILLYYCFFYIFCYAIPGFHITCSLMSISGDKENIGVTTIPPQNISQNISQRTDWVQCTPATPAPASRKKASWKPVDDEILLECLRQQQAAGHQLDTGFKPVAWTACALALKDSDKRSGGGPKTAKGCKDHFGTVTL